MKLILSSRNIKSIHSETFNDLSKLENLYLQNNSLSKIEFNSKDLKNLKFISFESNNIVDYDKSFFLFLNNLESVCLNNNPISILFPTQMQTICNIQINPKCKVYLNEKC